MNLFKSWKNVEYTRKSKMTAWRKIALGLWAAPNDPSIYSRMMIDARPIRTRLAAATAVGESLSVTALVVSAAARALAGLPGLNTVIRFGSLYERKELNVFVHILPDLARDDLTGFVVRNADRKTHTEIADDIGFEVSKIRNEGVDSLGETKDMLGGIPGLILYPLFRLLSFVMYSLNLSIPGLGMEKDCFGSIAVSTVGGFSDYEGFSPLDSYARCPIVIVIGAIRDEPRVIDGEIRVAPVLPLGLTFDHRLVDGVGCARFMQALQSELCGRISVELPNVLRPSPAKIAPSTGVFGA